MARPLRIEFPGCLYHVTSRGDRREAIYEDDQDRLIWLDVFGQACQRFNWVCHAWCLMTNHYHLLLETVDPTLSSGMRHLNGVFTQASNRRHGRTGHLFQGRFKAIVVQKESHLLEVARYIVLNPVRAGMVPLPEAWRWSSWHATVGNQASPDWLQVGGLLSHFADDGGNAVERYRQFVMEGMGLPSPLQGLGGQVILGNESFVKQMLEQAQARHECAEVPRVQKRAPLPTLAQFASQAADPWEAMALAYASGGYSMRQIAAHFAVHYSTVSRAVKARA